MSDAIDNILDGNTSVPVLLMTDEYLFEIVDRLGARVHAVLRDLPVIENVDDDLDELAKTREYQEAFQAGGVELLPAFKAFAAIINSVAPSLASALLMKLMRKPGLSTYWGYMMQHTDIGEFRKRLG